MDAFGDPPSAQYGYEQYRDKALLKVAQVQIDELHGFVERLYDGNNQKGLFAEVSDRKDILGFLFDWCDDNRSYEVAKLFLILPAEMYVFLSRLWLRSEYTSMIEKAHEIAKETGNEMHVLICLHALVISQLHLKQIASAEYNLEKATPLAMALLKKSECVNEKMKIEKILNRLTISRGLSKFLQGKCVDSIRILQEAKDTCEASLDHHHLCYVNIYLGASYSMSKDYSSAKPFFDEAIRIGRLHGFAEYVYIAHRLMLDMHLHLGDLEAVEHTRCLAIAHYDAHSACVAHLNSIRMRIASDGDYDIELELSEILDTARKYVFSDIEDIALLLLNAYREQFNTE